MLLHLVVGPILPPYTSRAEWGVHGIVPDKVPAPPLGVAKLGDTSREMELTCNAHPLPKLS